MSNLRQAAEQALEALEWSQPHADASITYEEAITALRAALAEPNKCIHGVTDGNCKECYMAEPVAWQWLNTANFRKKIPADATPAHWRPLYPAPPQRKPLTEEEVEKAYRHIWSNIPDGSYRTTYYWIEQGIRYAEQAHGIKGET